ncbi:MAG: DNA polymerase III subunit beta [Candidatus Krumholzibacteria bacterium]|nr:DNA polymerase III subunit beta [Candidatus Krumholzibacteria bacterium]
MKVSVPLGELSHKMNAISSVVPGKTTMPILSTVLMSADKEIFSISATDLDISVTSRVNGAITEEGRIAVPAKKLAEIVKSLSGDEVVLESKEDKLTLSCGKSRFVVNARSAEDFPKIPKQESKTSFAIDPEIIGELAQKTVYSVSTDLTRPALCGVLWEVDRKGIAMVSTDGHRLAKVEIAMDLPDAHKTDVIVPAKALGTMRTYAEGEKEVRVSIGENSISFDMKETTIYSRLLEGPFPNYQRVIPAKNEKELVVSRSALAEATKRVSILSDSLTRQVVFSIAKNKLTLNVSTQELGEAREEIEASFSGEPMEVGYNANYVLDLLRTIDAEEIVFLLDRPDNAALVKPASDGGNLKQLCIIMPLRIG